MGVLGKGSAHGACSLLHAAPLGYGASIALDLPITVRLLDRPSKREVNDPDGLLNAVLDVWIEGEHSLPESYEKEDLHWGVNSKIPIKQGLKSSAATSIGALRALCDATETQLEPADLVALSAQAQLKAGVSLTGSIDDAWACSTQGWKLVDIQVPVAEGVLLTGEGPKSDEWTVLLVLRGEREQQPALEDFAPHLRPYQQALNALQDGNELVAITWNGRGTVAALRDIQGRKMSNDSFMNSARSAGISGSGPALVVIVPRNETPTIERLKKWYTTRYKDIEIMETSFLSNETDDELE
jgi:shikimate kinase